MENCGKKITEIILLLNLEATLTIIHKSVIPKLFKPRHTKINMNISRHPDAPLSSSTKFFFHEIVSILISYSECNNSVQRMGLFLISDAQ